MDTPLKLFLEKLNILIVKILSYNYGDVLVSTGLGKLLTRSIDHVMINLKIKR